MNDQTSVAVHAHILVQTADQVSPDNSAKTSETPAKETPMSGASVCNAHAETERIFGIIILLHQTH